MLDHFLFHNLSNEAFWGVPILSLLCWNIFLPRQNALSLTSLDLSNLNWSREDSPTETERSLSHVSSRYRDIEMCRGVENVIYNGDCTRGCVCRQENSSTKLCVWLRPGRRCESLIVVKLWVWAQSCQLCRTLGRVVASQSDRARITQGQHDTALPRHCPGEIQEKPNSVLPSYLKTPITIPRIQGFLFYWPGL